MDDATYQQLASRTRNFSGALEGGPEGRRMLEAAIGMAGELSEITEPIKKYIFHGREINREKLIDELGDLLWYMDELCQVLGVTLDDVKQVNVRKLEKRYNLKHSEEENK
ncbi:MAG TPA: nucleoside triphosphate pyrophosphohydrolase family protein [Chloroflexia bacterium]|nr:nucleoside triphosphate pyrophosphohydrolase family protein [Chloroflexia bacterium]